MASNSAREPDAPKSLADPGAVAMRRDLLGLPHMAPLVALAAEIRAAHGFAPDADPLDGGAYARLLILLETPGPRVFRSGFVSRDNPTGTAANLFRALRRAGIPREDTLIWNAIPFVIHEPGALNRSPRRAEVRAGLAWLPPLLERLPRLACVVMAGRSAEAARETLSNLRSGLLLLAMPHPSPTYVCTSPTVMRRIDGALEEARGVLGIAAPRPGAG
jgi:hypothetical protein